MTLEEKQQEIFKDIALHNKEFIRQASIKIDKRYAPNPLDPLELVSDVIYSIAIKLDNKENINRYYKMVKEDMLFNYICKAIDTNCKFKNAPFLRNKLRIINRIPIVGDNAQRTQSNVRNWNLENYNNEIEDEQIEKQEALIDDIYLLMEPSAARELLGKHWKYYVTIFREYIQDSKTSYTTLSQKYNIPRPTLAKNILTIKNAIRNEIEKNYENKS